MTAPRQVLPGQVYLVTRRCTQRQFLLRPDDETTEIFLYALGEASARFGIELIAWLASSNHYHAVVHDPHGDLPRFLERFHKLCAKALNARWKRWENFWASEPTCAVRLVEARDVIDKVVYTLANPVLDHLVDRVVDWPGASSFRYADGRPLVVRRPRVFFRDGGTMPEEVTLAARTPPSWNGDHVDWAECVNAAVLAQERATRDARLATGRRLVGRRRVIAVSAFDRPSSVAPRRTLRPHIACRSARRREREIAALRQFRAAHAAARRRFAAGERDVVFPAGTFLMRVTFGARCAVPS